MPSNSSPAVPNPTSPAALQLEAITVSFNERCVLDAFNLTVGHDEIVCLLGPSGVGKTTVLRVIAGLIRPRSGQVYLLGNNVTEIPTHKRNIGFVFQDLALFSHMNVGENIEYGLRMRGVPKTARKDRTDELLELTGLQQFAHRSVTSLSGGERQRVALARALAPRPFLLLLDEPLSALDDERANKLASDIRRICKEQRTSAVYITHDAHEASTVGDRSVQLSAPN
jgi:ABC-type Fe3+/spermidine/putrescine transport system ATPase subunit